MKRCLICLVCLLLAGALAPRARALEVPGPVQEVLDEAPVEPERFREMSLPALLGELLGNWKEQLEAPARLLARLTVFLLLGTAAAALAPEEHWRESLETILVIGLFLLACRPALELMEQVTECIQGWYTYLAGFVPVFCGIMVSCGQPGGAGVYSGMFLAMANFSAQLISTVALPLLTVDLTLCAAAALCTIDGLQDCCELVGRAVRWLLKFAAVLFGAVLGLQTVLAQGADNLALKTGRFLVGGAVPVVGGAVSDAMGSVLAALRVLKGSLGFAAVAVLAAAFLPLLLRCTACALVTLLGAAAAKACGFRRGGAVLRGISRSVSLCISFLVFFFMLVVLTTALMIVTGNGG